AGSIRQSASTPRRNRPRGPPSLFQPAILSLRPRVPILLATYSANRVSTGLYAPHPAPDSFGIVTILRRSGRRSVHGRISRPSQGVRVRFGVAVFPGSNCERDAHHVLTAALR